jgi:phosphatidylinositol alpha-1,6-mannosyltransferase
MADLSIDGVSGAKPGILLVTELFPPQVGGSAELLANTYERIVSVPTTVLTDAPNAAPTRGPVQIVNARLRTTRWGVLHPAALLHHLDVANQIRKRGREGVGAVHCGRALPEGLAAMLARAVGTPPYLCWAHGEEIGYIRSSRELSWLASRVYRRASAVVANSQNTANVLAAFGVAADRIHVVRPGVDSDRFHPGVSGAADLRRELTSEEGVVCLTVGRLQERKGHDLVIRTLAALGEAASGVKYVIVGDGEERGRLESLVREMQLESAVVFKGRVPSDDLPRYYAAADIFVHPNRIVGNDFEGFGIVFLEAAACGLPVIAGKSGGVPEAVVDGETGLLVSGTDVEELKSALLKLLSAPHRRRTMGHAGRLRASTEFTWQRAADRVAAVHDVIAAPRTRRRSH